MKLRNVEKKIGSLLLAAAMIITSFPASGTEVQAASGASEPSSFATKDQLKDFNTDDTDDAGENPAKLYFGTDEQEWWIAGCQDKSADSVTLFAASPLGTTVRFDDYFQVTESTKTKTYNAGWGCTYIGSVPSEVNTNHYGGSTLRTTLKGLETSQSYFSSAEQDLMKKTTVLTNDIKNSSTYTTTDKLYLAYGDGEENSEKNQYVTVGKNKNVSGDLNNGLRIDKKYWGDKKFWLRAPKPDEVIYVGVADPFRELSVIYDITCNWAPTWLVPAFELNLSSVLFASAAKAASSEIGNCETSL